MSRFTEAVLLILRAETAALQKFAENDATVKLFILFFCNIVIIKMQIDFGIMKNKYPVEYRKQLPWDTSTFCLLIFVPVILYQVRRFQGPTQWLTWVGMDAFMYSLYHILWTIFWNLYCLIWTTDGGHSMISLHSMSGNVYISNIRGFLVKNSIRGHPRWTCEIHYGIASYDLVFLRRFWLNND